MYGADCDRMEFGLYDIRHSLTAMLCIVLRCLDRESSLGGVMLLLLILIVFSTPVCKHGLLLSPGTVPVG